MPRLAALFLGLIVAGTSGQREAPSYTSASIVNAAANVPGLLAPNTFASIYGEGLAFVTRQISIDDIRGGLLPTVLNGTGVRVLVNRIPANVYYVSPKQINILIPPTLQPGPAEVQLVLDGISGPAVAVQLDATAPAFFQLDPSTILAAHPDGSVVTSAAPARAGDVIVAYATGLGPTSPQAGLNEIPQGAAPLLTKPRVLFNGADLDPRRIAYAGVAPGYAGLYQINIQLPDALAADPEIRIGFGDRLSPGGLKLVVK